MLHVNTIFDGDLPEKCTFCRFCDINADDIFSCLLGANEESDPGKSRLSDCPLKEVKCANCGRLLNKEERKYYCSCCDEFYCEECAEIQESEENKKNES